MDGKDIALIKALSGGGSGGGLPTGGAPYQQLVTDGTGKATWEDRLVVDSELSDTSTNPVQNKVVKSALDNLSGTLIVNLTKDETKFPFTSASRVYTADKTYEEISEAIGSGRNVVLFASYITSDGRELFGLYHLVGYNQGTLGFIDVKMVQEAIFAGASPIVGYDVIVLHNSGFWAGSYIDLSQSVS